VQPSEKDEHQVKRALVVGVTGQDGAYLSRLLLDKGYRVFGLNRSELLNTERLHYLGIDGLVEPIEGDVTDQGSIVRALRTAEPEEVYNLAAQSSVAASWQQPGLTCHVTGIGAITLLEAIRLVNPSIRFYQASTSEMFGDATDPMQSETTRFHPRNPYAAAKLFAHWTTINYRESYGMFACAGILFNHESPIRGLNFVTRKISHGVARIKRGLGSQISLGNLAARRDWGFAGDYAEAMWLMLQAREPKDYVVATGHTASVEDFCRLAFAHAALNWRDHVKVDASLMRPADVSALCGNASRARIDLGWEPRTGLEQLVAMMVDADLARVSSEG
jgi:GDPmannose 4,6-dehydratase